jgi:hypothetical protein
VSRSSAVGFRRSGCRNVVFGSNLSCVWTMSRALYWRRFANHTGRFFIPWHLTNETNLGRQRRVIVLLIGSTI